MINLRGHVVPVYDLRMSFGLPKDTKQTRAPCVLIVDRPGQRITGDRAPGRPGLRRAGVFSRGVQPPPQLGLGKATPFVRGLIRHQDGFLLVLDVDRVFSTLGSLNGEGV